MAIVNKQIGLTDTIIHTVPAGSRHAITTLLICNKAAVDTGGSNDTSVDLHLIPNGQAKGNADPNANQILNGRFGRQVCSECGIGLTLNTRKRSSVSSRFSKKTSFFLMT